MMDDLPPAEGGQQTRDAERQAVVGLIQSGHLDQAAGACANLCERWPDDADAWYLLSAISGMRGDYPAVEECCSRVIALRPDAHAAYVNLGNALSLQNRPDEAERAFLRAYQLQPDDPQVLVNWANLQRTRGQYAEAIENYSRALSFAPQFPEAYNNLASCQFEMGDLDAARGNYEAALRLQPAYPDALNNLASLLMRQEQYDLARTRVHRALQINPQYPAAYLNLAAIERACADDEAALRALLEGHSKCPRSVELLCHIGHTLVQLGRAGEAVAYFRNAMAMDPGSLEACLGLGVCSDRLGESHDAAACYYKALQIKPDSIEALTSLARLQYLGGETRRAEESYRRILEIDRGCFRALIGLAKVVAIEGRFEEASRHLDEAEALEPGNTAIVLERADHCERRGEYETAAGYLLPLVQDGMVDPQLATVFATVAGKVGREEEALALLGKALDLPDLTAKNRQDLHFRTARLLDRKGDHRSAFRHFQASHEQVRHDYTPESHTRIIDVIIGAYHGDSVPRLARSRLKSERPIFIVGMPRSGTSLTEQVLSRHPDVHAAGELEDLAEVSKSAPGTTTIGKQHLVSAVNLGEADLDRLAESYLDRLSGYSAMTRFVTDKMPYNYLLLGFIQQLFPHARVIHCRRDPLDTCLSCYFQSFIGSHEYTHDLENLGHYYNEYRRLMAHWERVLELPIMSLDYERMVSDQETVTRELLDFCDLEWDDRCLEFHKADRHVKTASYEQVRKPLYTSSVGRWKQYEAELAPLIRVLQEQGNLP